MVGVQKHALAPQTQGGDQDSPELWCPPLGKKVCLGPLPKHSPTRVGYPGLSPQQLQQPPLHVPNELLLPCLLCATRGLPLQSLSLRPLQSRCPALAILPGPGAQEGGDGAPVPQLAVYPSIHSYLSLSLYPLPIYPQTGSLPPTATLPSVGTSIHPSTSCSSALAQIHPSGLLPIHPSISPPTCHTFIPPSLCVPTHQFIHPKLIPSSTLPSLCPSTCPK